MLAKYCNWTLCEKLNVKTIKFQKHDINLLIGLTLQVVNVIKMVKLRILHYALLTLLSFVRSLLSEKPCQVSEKL